MFTYRSFQWVLVEDDIITIGINDMGVGELENIESIHFCEVGEPIDPHSPIVEIMHEGGTFNIYSPIDGDIAEINTALNDDPALLEEDSYGDGWLIKVVANDPIDPEELALKANEEF